MFCPNCGAEVPEGAAKCDSCGTYLAAGEPAPVAPVAPPPPPVPTYTPAYTPAGPTAETSGLAIASMVLGLVSLLAGGGMLLIPGILALVLGYMARNQIRESGGKIRGDEFAIVGMVTGGISLLIGLVLCLLVGFGFALSCLPFCMLPFFISEPSSSRYQ